jgi:hypothetical protein
VGFPHLHIPEMSWEHRCIRGMDVASIWYLFHLRNPYVKFSINLILLLSTATNFVDKSVK